MLKLNIIVVSTRPGRVGRTVADWFHGQAKAHGKFEVELVDLKDMALPLYDEAKPPVLGRYEHEHTKRWSASVRSADAFVFVSPEYDHFVAPSLVNAVVYLFKEWHYKPAGFVSYGGVSGGIRAVQAAKQLLTAVSVMPVAQGVFLPFVAKSIGEDGKFQGSEANAAAFTTLLDELLKWSEALKPLRG